MATGTWKLVRVQVGTLSSPATASCAAGTVHAVTVLESVETGMRESATVCIGETALPCDPNGLAMTLKLRGYTLVDDPCGAERVDNSKPKASQNA